MTSCERGRILTALAMTLGLIGVWAPPAALAKAHHPLPEVIMLDEEPEELPPKKAPKAPAGKAAAKTAPPASVAPVAIPPTPSETDLEDAAEDVVDTEAADEAEDSTETLKAPTPSQDRDRIAIREENEVRPRAPAASPSPAAPAAPAKATATEAMVTQNPEPVAMPKTEPVATVKTAPAATSTTGPTTPDAAPVAAPKPGATRKSFSSFSTEVQDVSSSPSVAAPTGTTEIMPLAHEALKNPEVRDPLAPPDLTPDNSATEVDAATLPRELPPKLTPKTTSTKNPKTKLRGKKPKAAAAMKSKTKRRAASTAKSKKAAGAVFEQAPAPSLTEDPDAPYRDPALDQDAEEDVEEIVGPFPDRDPAEEDGDVRTFKDTIRSIVDFNNQWEVNFVNHGRYRIRGQPNELFDYQQSGQYLEIQVLESERRILSIQPTKVRFRQIR